MPTVKRRVKPLKGWQLRVGRRVVNCPAFAELTMAEQGLVTDLGRLYENSLGYVPRWLALKTVRVLRERGWRG